MNRAILATLTAVAILASPAAFAKGVTDTIQSIDKKADTIRLSDGTTLSLPENIEVESLQVGEKVMVTYSTKAGKHLVSAIRQVQ